MHNGTNSNILANPLASALTYEKLKKAFGLSRGALHVWGVQTGRISSLLCAKCRVSDWNHGNEGEEQHPFFKDNLEMLEWEYEKSTKSTRE